MLGYYSDTFVLPLPDGHRFPMAKYRLLREAVQRQLPAVQLRLPNAVSEDALCLAHDPAYVHRVMLGLLSEREVRVMGFPWSPELVERSRRSAGGTLDAARAALVDGVAVNLAGGTHHAGIDRGQGYCVFNDVGVAARCLLATGEVRRVLVIDLDVHQGNGTAEVLASEPRAFTFSMHGARNFPFRKATSDWDIGLADGVEDAEYLATLRGALPVLFERVQPDLVFYVAGVDPFEGDTLGRMRLTQEGLAARDTLVLRSCGEREVPVAISMAGGYAPVATTIADLHLQTVSLALQLHQGSLLDPELDSLRWQGSPRFAT